MNSFHIKVIVLFCILTAVFLVSCETETSENRAEYLFASGQYEEAGNLFELRHKSNPENDTLIYYLGLCRYFSEDYERADYYFKKLIESGSSYSLPAYMKKGTGNFKLGNYEGAVKDFTEYIRRDSINGRAFYFRACSYYMMDMQTPAKKDWYKSTSLGFDINLDYNYILDKKRDIEILSN